MRFGVVQKELFGTYNGAYSLVTKTEFEDSQITATDAEAEILVNHFGKDSINVGKVGSNSEKSAKKFRRFPDGKEITLNLVYPKPTKTELRLYLSARAGYKPKTHDVWFLFRKDDTLWIGSLPENKWRQENAIYKDTPDYGLDNDPTLIANDTVPIPSVTHQVIYPRSARVAKLSMEACKYKCEYDKEHHLFISRFSGTPFLEAHHLVPIRFQAHFPSTRLDIKENVFCLCPNCHRAVHNATEKEAREILSKLSEKRPVINKFSLNLEDLYRLYSVEEIVR